MPPKGKVRWLSPSEQAVKDAQTSQSNSQTFQQLLQIFHGQIDDNVIQLIVQSNNYDFDQSMDVLSQMVGDIPDDLRQSVNQNLSQKPSQSSKQSSVNAASQWAHGSINKSKKSTVQSAELESSSLWPSLAGEINQPTQKFINSKTASSKSSQISLKVNQAISQSIVESFNSESALSESIWDPPTTSQSATHPINQSTEQTNQLASEPINHSPRQLPKKAHKQIKIQPIKQSAKQSNDPAATESNPFYTIRVLDSDSDFSESEITNITEQSNKLSINQSTDQSADANYQTITNGELDPMHYLTFVNQSLHQMRDQSDQALARKLQQKLNMEPITQLSDQSISHSVATFPELSLEQLKLAELRPLKANNQSTSQSSQSSGQSSQPGSQSLHMDREGLLELLCLMFDSIDRSLIASLLESIDQSNVQSLNEIVETLTSITAEEQLMRDDDSDDQSDYPSVNQPTSQSSSQSSNQSAKLGSGDQKLELTDLEIAHRMATDPKWSPPRAARSINHSASNPSKQRFSKSKAVKLDMSKPVYAWPTNQPLGDQWKLKTIKQYFPTIERDLIEEIFACNQSNYQQSISHLRELFPEECMLPVNELPPILDQSEQPVDQPVRPKRYSAASIASRVNRTANQSAIQSSSQIDDTDYEGESLIPDSVMEYEIGATLDNRAHHSNDSAFTRADAAAHANRRALFFRAATACFHANKGAEAKQFAKLGHFEGGMIMETSVASAAHIFRANNKDLDCNRKIDLHGLHVKEAICFLDFAIRRMRKRGGGDSIVAVTGRGMHSQGGRSRLKPAMQRFCERHRYRSAEIKNAEVRIIFG